VINFENFLFFVKTQIASEINLELHYSSLIIISFIAGFLIFFAKRPHIQLIITLTTLLLEIYEVIMIQLKTPSLFEKITKPDSLNIYQYGKVFGNLDLIFFSTPFSVDNISYTLIVLTVLLTFISLGLSLNLHDFRLIASCFFIMQGFLFMAWIVQDLFVFYFCFESVLIPMYVIILYYGKGRAKRAAWMLFLYTVIGSLPMLIGILWLYNFEGTVDMIILQNTNLAASSFNDTQLQWIWLAFFLAFATKVPICPLHLWLPEAHVEAPTGGSVFLAGILLKLGSFGMLKILIPIFPDLSIKFAPFVVILCLCSIGYTAFSAIRQIDLKQVIAYASISHMNLIILGLFCNNVYGIQASLFQMISHGLVSGLLFMLIGLIYDRYNTRIINNLGGLYLVLPNLSFFFKVALLANMAFPLTSSFIGELLLILGVFKGNVDLGFLVAILCIFLGGAYNFWLMNRILYGNENTSVNKETLYTVNTPQNRNYSVLEKIELSLFVLLSKWIKSIKTIEGKKMRVLWFRAVLLTLPTKIQEKLVFTKDLINLVSSKSFPDPLLAEQRLYALLCSMDKKNFLNNSLKINRDLTLFEFFLAFVLFLLIILFGLFPNIIFDLITIEVEYLLTLFGV
jgi:proton-translocating NADH-quinone oxidoreductase chain M